MGADHAAVFEHGNPVGDLKDFGDAMRDVDHTYALGLEGPDDVEEMLQIPPAQGGGGFVHDDQARIQGKGLGNFHHLRLGDAQAGQADVRIDVYPQAVEHLFGLLLQLPGVHDPQAALRLAAEEYVFGHGHVGEQVELLVDDADS